MEDRPIISPGSLFKSSESWLTIITSGFMADGMSSATSPWAQSACALAAGAVVCMYIWSRSQAKCTVVEEVDA